MPNNELNMRARELLAAEIEATGDGRTARNVRGNVPFTLTNTDPALRAIEKALSQDTGFAEGIEKAAKVAEHFNKEDWDAYDPGTIAAAIRSLLPSSPVVGRDE